MADIFISYKKERAAYAERLGFMYEFGRGVEQNFTEAAAWYEKAAQRGESFAQNNLGQLLEGGRGVARDLSKAASWFKRSALGGSQFGQFNYGRVLEQGIGVAKDLKEALVWYQKAATLNHAAAKAAVQRLTDPSLADA